MFTRFRHVFGVLFFLLVASCSGGGCASGCGSCGGLTPLPGGFPKEKTVENAASVRLSRPGLDFVEKNAGDVVARIANAPGGVLSFDIPNADPPKTQIADLTIGKVLLDPNVCPGGPDPKATPPRCRADIDIGKGIFRIDSVTPSAVKVKATIPIKLEDTPIAAELRGELFGAEFGIGTITLHVGYGNNVGGGSGCNGGKPEVAPHELPLEVTIPLVAESTAPRNGYTKIDVANATINLDGLGENDVKVCSSCGFATDVCSAITNSGFVKGLVVGPLKSGLESQVRTLLADQLCTAPNVALNPSCPTGSSPDGANKRCVYDSDKNKCVSTLLGTDAHVDLGGFLASISPGTAGGLDFGLAAGGPMKPFPNAAPDGQGRTVNGIALGMLGGVAPSPPSKCVPQADIKAPTGIPLPDELAPTKADDPKAPHVGLALSGRFLDYTFGSVYNSGLLCLGVSSEQFDMLRSGLLSIIIPSIKNLAFEQGEAAAAIATRPQAPPTVKIGGGTNVNTDPLLSITLPKLAIDFYLWHLDRFVRVFTFQADLTIPVNLQTGKDASAGGITPAIGEIKVANGSVTNADLLMDDPALVASSLSGLLGGIGKQLVGGGIAPIDLAGALKSLGLGLEINTIKKLTKGTDDYVGVFANLSKVAAGTATVEADTMATLVSKHVPVDHMQLATMDRAARPELVVDLASPLDDGRHQVEYAWWIDRGTRSTWSTEKHLSIKDDQLLLQGRHVLKVSARLVGSAETEDATPAEVPFTIDALAPLVKIEKSAGQQATIRAWDVVSSEATLVGRYRLDDKELGAWMPIGEMTTVDVGSAETLDVEVKDEEGNVRSVRQELIRGKADGSLAAAGCGCSTPGSSSPPSGGVLAAVLGLAGLALVAYRRRAGSGRSFHVRSAHAALALGTITVVAATSQGCACGSEANVESGCGADCAQECRPELALGLPGSYTSVAKAADGSIWVAGYNDALLSEGESELWGDLVVGKYDLGQEKVAWKTVDGLPVREPGTCADRSSGSWRNGESDSGDDVGLWTSIQVGANGHPMVSYYDATNKKLKLAFETDEGWSSITVKEQPLADIGRYSKMLLVDGKPVIAFLQIEPGNGGKTRSKVVVARSNVESPREASDFRFEDAAVEEDNPCAASTCDARACVKASGICTSTVSGCTPSDCGTGKACVTESGKATCVATKAGTQTYPDVFGDFISLAQVGGRLGMVVYDRPHGNLVALAEQGAGKWVRSVIDGETGSRKDKTAIDTGDVGVAASLAIDSTDTWHVTYVSGLDETLRYLTVKGGKPGKPEIIDDGSAVDGKAFPDGKHVVGDDSAVRVQGDVVTVFYQDATIGTLRRASGTKSGTTHKWELRTLQQPNKFGGYFPQIVPGEDKVANFWEQTDRATKSRIGDVTILSP
jgi:MYXO-CTERM domain-containing protein